MADEPLRPLVPGGGLTLTGGQPVTPPAAGTLYYQPALCKRVPVWDGRCWRMLELREEDVLRALRPPPPEMPL